VADPPAAAGEGPALLALQDLTVSFRHRQREAGAPRRFRAVDGVSLDIRPGEVLGLVGESGSGKTTIGKTLLRLHEPAEGRIIFRGTDITHLREAALRPYRRDLQMIFQDPLSSFNPRHSIGESLAIPLLLHNVCRRAALADEIGRRLAAIGLSPAMRDRYPHELSGGQLQRVAIARALTLSPALIVADEPVSKLDVSVRAQILNLLKDVQARLGLALLFITHDLHVARYLCHRIGVMYFGKLVELAPTATLFAAPRHPYTQALLGTISEEATVDDPAEAVRPAEAFGEPRATAGCRYAARCPIQVARCTTAHPPSEAVAPGHFVACYERGRSAPAASVSRS
jgi:oligopeptide/dipeptide ABC transporter ATP-binding protein